MVLCRVIYTGLFFYKMGGIVCTNGSENLVGFLVEGIKKAKSVENVGTFSFLL